MKTCSKSSATCRRTPGRSSKVDSPWSWSETEIGCSGDQNEPANHNRVLERERWQWRRGRRPLWAWCWWEWWWQQLRCVTFSSFIPEEWQTESPTLFSFTHTFQTHLLSLQLRFWPWSLCVNSLYFHFPFFLDQEVILGFQIRLLIIIIITLRRFSSWRWWNAVKWFLRIKSEIWFVYLPMGQHSY